MDTRPRPLIHNPNHQTMQGPPPLPPSSNSHATIYQPPSSSQPPVQIPFSDPFQRRPDPFLPSAQQRRGSIGYSNAHQGRDGPPSMHGGLHNGPERPMTGGWQPGNLASAPPPPSLHHTQGPPGPPTTFGPPPPHISSNGYGPAPHSYDHGRRASISGQSPPRYNYGQPEPSQQMSAAFAGRQMPPPSPSQQAATPHQYDGPRGPPPPPLPAYPSMNRDLPGPGRMGLSINSILGGDASGPQLPRSRGSPPQSMQSQLFSGMRPPSPPKKHQSLGSRAEFTASWKRPTTPDRLSMGTAPRPPEATSFSASSSPRHFASRGSPEFARSGPSIVQQPFAVAPPPDIRNYSPASVDIDRSRQQIEPMPPRPSSQPAVYALSRDDPRNFPQQAAPYRPPYGGPPPQEFGRPPQYGPPGPPYGPQDRATTVGPGGPSPYAMPSQEQARREQMDGYRQEDPMRPAYRSAFTPMNQPGPPHGPEAPRSHPQHFDPYRPPNEPSIPGQPEAMTNHHRPSLQSQPSDRTDHHVEYPRNPYAEPRAAAPGEPMQRSRSYLSAGSEINRHGRNSPLPQAVIGVSPHPSGPSEHSTIKSEFGRIFPGLGSGLGGRVPGSSTPTRQSPMPGHRGSEDQSAQVANEVEGPAAPRNGRNASRMAGQNNRGRKSVKDEDRMDLDGGDGRATPAGRANKRSRAGHHHHLPTAQPHHHHVHAHDDIVNHPHPFSKFNSVTPAQSATPHHHHHIHSAAHHHHHPPKPSPAAISHPLPKPKTTINSRAVFESVKHLPSHHLGSELYNPPIEAAASPTAKHGFTSYFKIKKCFTIMDANCTYTIRIPRYHLTPSERERICAERALWGSEVYTDDSDPLAAAMHSGWIRGEWSEEIDQGMLDLPSPPRTPDDADDANIDELSSPPTNGPIVPPIGQDLQITIRILPTLQQYHGSVLYGIKSRDWCCDSPTSSSTATPTAKATSKAAANGKAKQQDASPSSNATAIVKPQALHDGMSFVIDKIRWVDEGLERGFERNAESRRKRAAANALVSLFAGGAEKRRRVGMTPAPALLSPGFVATPNGDGCAGGSTA